MARKDRQISSLACVLLVTLRLFIGWHLLYEGLWKLNTLDTPQPWTAEGYLRNSQGPLRNVFRGMTGDPDDLRWLDYDEVAGRWDRFAANVKAKYPDFSDEQQRRLDLLLNGPATFAAELAELPAGVEIRGSLGKVIRFDAERKRLIVDGKMHLLPAERERLIQVGEGARPTAPEAEWTEEMQRQNDLVDKFIVAVRQVYQRAANLSLKDEAAVLLNADPERVGVIMTDDDGTVIEKRVGDVELYRARLALYESRLEEADQDFRYEHLNRQWGEIQQLRAKLVGPVKALEARLLKATDKLLTPAQLAMGPARMPRTEVDDIDERTMWSLTIIGALLIVGLFSRITALAGAGLLTLFYLAMPPWPGVPEPPGPEHALIINKNLIEATALLAIAALPTGRWFGIDAIFAAIFRGQKRRKQESQSA